MASKAENGFLIIRQRSVNKMSDALHRACVYISKDCRRCPLEEHPQCAKNAMPPAFTVGEDPTICEDWLTLYFRAEYENSPKADEDDAVYARRYLKGTLKNQVLFEYDSQSDGLDQVCKRLKSIEDLMCGGQDPAPSKWRDDCEVPLDEPENSPVHGITFTTDETTKDQGGE